MNTEKRLLTVTEADQWKNFGKHAKMVRICSANHAPTQIFSHTHRIIHMTRIRGNFWKTGCHMQMLTSNLEIGINCVRRNMLKQQSFVWRPRMKKRTLTSLLITTLLSDFHTFSRMTTQTNLNYFSGLPRRATTLLTNDGNLVATNLKLCKTVWGRMCFLKTTPGLLCYGDEFLTLQRHRHVLDFLHHVQNDSLSINWIIFGYFWAVKCMHHNLFLKDYLLRSASFLDLWIHKKGPDLWIPI